ncbi:MAG: DUF4258 domain-containing protein [Syntrophomonas sp.]
MKELSIVNLKKLIENKQIIWRSHMLLRMQQRGIKIENVLECISHGEIIEHYYDDYPFPSCLILGYFDTQQYLHVVCAVGQNRIWMITAYFPDAKEWNEDLKTRRK